MEKIPYLKSLKAACDDVVNFFMFTEPLPESTWLFVQGASVENRTTNFDAVRVGRGNSYLNPHWWEEHVTCLVDVLYWLGKEVHFVAEGERVIFRFDGCTLGDRIFCEVEGYTSEKMIPGRPFRRGKAG